MNTITFMTRHNSYEDIMKNLYKRHKDILQVLGDKELTTREIATKLYENRYTNTADVNNVRPRITELENLGLVITENTKKCNITNKEVAVYRKTTQEEQLVIANMNHIPRLD